MTYNIPVLLWKKLNSLIYRTLFYVNIYESYKLLKNSPVFWPTLYILKASTDVLYVSISEFEMHTTRRLLWHSDITKFNFGPSSAPNTAEGAYDAPPNLLVGWGEDTPSPFSTPSTPSASRCRCRIIFAVGILSVCPSVRCVYCDKTKQRTANMLIPHETGITLVF